jgi:hypothetical protein
VVNTCAAQLFAVITQADWLDELLNHAQRPEVGVVGAKLFNPDGCVLHAGLILVCKAQWVCRSMVSRCSRMVTCSGCKRSMT